MTMPYKIHHRRLSLKMEHLQQPVFREEEDQGFYLQAIVPYSEYEAIAVFRRDLPDSGSAE